MPMRSGIAEGDQVLELKRGATLGTRVNRPMIVGFGVASVIAFGSGVSHGVEKSEFNWPMTPVDGRSRCHTRSFPSRE